MGWIKRIKIIAGFNDQQSGVNKTCNKIDIPLCNKQHRRCNKAFLPDENGNVVMKYFSIGENRFQTDRYIINFYLLLSGDVFSFCFCLYHTVEKKLYCTLCNSLLC